MLTAVDVTGADAQLPLIQIATRADERAGVRPDTAALMPLSWYDLIVVTFSGGKDSLAVLLDTLEKAEAEGVRDRVEIWHHGVDGEPGQVGLMDWPALESYVRAVGAALRVRVRFQWKEGGIERELYRENALTAPTTFELADGRRVTKGGTTGKPNTRRRFPAKGADLQSRWCSGTVKIDVEALAIRNDPALRGKRVLSLSGERREESANRARYARTEAHRAHGGGRVVTRHRPVLDWSEQQVWAVIERHGVVPFVAYYLGFGRVSCMKCIFLGADHWATIRLIDPAGFERIAQAEEEFGHTIDRRYSVREQADRGTPVVDLTDPQQAAWVAQAMRHDAYTADDVVLQPGDVWQLPAGAYRKTGGPV